MKTKKKMHFAHWGFAMLLAFSMATSVFAQLEPTFAITEQPTAITVVEKDSSVTLSFVAQMGNEKVSYQWYSSADGSTNNAIALKGADESSFKTGAISEKGVRYYFCVASVGEKSVTSDVAAVAYTGLPVLYVNTPKGVKIEDKEKWIKKTTLTLRDAKNSKWNFEDDTTSIRGRGNSTWEQPKKPYALKLDNKTEIMGMPKHKRWVLIANYLDNSFLKNHMAFYLSEKFEMDYTVRGEFVNLVLNGVYRGLYWLGEAIKVDKKRVNIYDGEDEMADTDDKDLLIEMDSHYDEVVKFTTPIRKMPYMVKNDDYFYDEDNNNEMTSGGTARLGRFQTKITNLENLLYPDYNTNDDCKANTNYCSAPDEAYKGIIDVESWAKFWLINEIMDNTELNEPKSAYFTYQNKKEGDVFKAGPVWDFDAGATKALTSVKLDTSIYYNALFKSPKFIKAVKDVWNKYSSTIDFNTEIQTMRSKLATAAKLDSLMWGDHKDYLENAISGFDGNVDFLKTSLINKKGVVGKYVNNKVFEYVVQNGEVLTGTFGANDKISIADGATVTLNNVIINGVNSNDYNWAGITCLGDCEIVLAENSKNTVKGFSYDYPGIYVPKGNTLTISGTGSLDASSNGYGAGIGGGWGISCGSIVISGGTIVARGGAYAAGIGGGAKGNVESITISGSDTKVTAIKGEHAPYSIGEGADGSRTGDITIGGTETSSIVGSPFKYPVVQYTVAFDANGGNGTMSDQSTNIDPEPVLEANSFTRDGYSFVGWNTRADGSGISYADQGHVNFAEVGSSITLYAQWYKGSVVNLATLEDHYTAKNGDVLTGTLGGNYKISIEENATVTLNNVAINGVDDDNYDWPGITCLGKCEIILAENSKNTVRGFYEGNPGIYVPEGNTLTISGTGSLDASSNGYGAGIGGGYYGTAGNIVINGGTVFAKGSYYAAGIGGGLYGNVGNIEINGGTIVAKGGDEAVGIGGGCEGTVGNITISGNDTKVTAIKGDYAPYSIGESHYGSRTGKITIDGIETSSIIGSPFTYPVPQYTVTFDANGGNGTMSDQSTNVVPELILETNSFTRDGYSFVGWNTEADGSGASYGEQAYVNLAELGKSITLYAQWLEGNVVDLAALTGNYIAQNGVVLTGVLGGDYKISIADGATVTLNSVLIDGVNNDNYNWAGITCLGECNIILADNSVNEVKGFYESYPGIYVPEGNTLTISGTGSLNASSNGYGAGIGGGWGISCGNIVIDGGTIVATGGQFAAGIGGGSYGTAGNIFINGGTVTATGGVAGAGIGGGGQGTAGNIVINGGTVTATGGGYAAPGIGGGTMGVVGSITITDNVTKVTATKGEKANYSIGGDDGSRKGDITIGGVVYDNNIEESPFVYPKTTEYAAVQIREYNSGWRAVIDGAYGKTDAVEIAGEIKDVAVEYNRAFPVGAYSTIVLPFDVNTANVSGLQAVLYYNGIGKDKNGKDAVKMKVLWAEKGVIKDADGKDKEYEHTTISANTPYLVKMKNAEFKVDGKVTLKATTEAVTKYPEWEWEFRGVWEYKKWEKGDPELGFAYGFAASAPKDSKIKVGDFVKVGEGAWISPFRAYLVSSNVRKAQGVRANGNYVMRPTVQQKELPEFMNIIVDDGDANDDNAEHTTVIGQFNTRTGEIKMNYDHGKFDLKGRRVNGSNNARGAYYGKNVLKK